MSNILNTENPSVVIIGAGIIGICCALNAQRAGFNVTVIDRDEPGSGCSFGNAGYVSPGAIMPFAMPGTIWSVPKWLLNPLGPLAVRPTHLPSMLPWLFRWVEASKAKEVRRISTAMHSLHNSTLRAYKALLPAGDTQLISATGLLQVSTKNTFPESVLAPELREVAGARCQILSAGELRELEPALSSEFCSGALFPDNGFCANPFALVQYLAGEFIRGGGTIKRSTAHAFRFIEQKPAAIISDDEDISFDKLVIATGAWSGGLARKLGHKLPLQAERGYHVTILEPEVMPSIPVSNRDYSFATTPMNVGLRIAGTAEFASVDAKPNWRRATVLLDHAKRMYPGLSGAKFTKWMGPRPSLPDGLPIIDRSSRYSNVVFAFGHSHFGLMAAPMTGQIVTALLSDRPFDAFDLAPFSADRF